MEGCDGLVILNSFQDLLHGMLKQVQHDECGKETQSSEAGTESSASK